MDKSSISGWRRRHVLAAGAAGASVAIAGGRMARAAEPRRGGTIRVACSAATSIDPIKMDTAGAIAIVQQAAEYLVWIEPDFSLRPVLATSWTTPDAGHTWLFEIRRGVKFHDGRDLTPHDVVASFQRLVDPKVASQAKADLSFLEKDGISVAGEHGVSFKLTRPIGNFPYYTQIYQAVILPADYAGDFAEKPIGTGPFRMTRYRPQQSAEFVRNETYWDKGRPYLDGLALNLYETTQPIIIAMQGGAADMMQITNALDVRPLLNDPSIKIVASNGAEHRQLTMNVTKKPFDDKRVRQAVALCFDRDALVQRFLGSKALIGNDHPISPAYPDKFEIPQRHRDLAKARELLAAAGYPQGFPIDLYTTDIFEMGKYALLAKQMLAPAGIAVNLKIEPPTVYFAHWKEVTLGLTNWTTRGTAAQMLATPLKGGSELNAAHYANPEVDRLIDQIEAEVSDQKRARLLRQVALIINDDVPSVITYFLQDLRPVRQNIMDAGDPRSGFLDLSRAYLA